MESVEQLLDGIADQAAEGSGDRILIAIAELHRRQQIMRRVLAGTTGYLRNGYDDLATWAK